MTDNRTVNNELINSIFSEILLLLVICKTFPKRSFTFYSLSSTLTKRSVAHFLCVIVFLDNGICDRRYFVSHRNLLV